MRVFVIGATGWIGGAITDAFLGQGSAVSGLARSDDAMRQLAAKGATGVLGELSDGAALSAAATAADAIVFAAAAPPAATHAALGTLRAAIAGSGKPLVYISGSSRYGHTAEDGPTDEDAFIRRLATAAMRDSPEAALHHSDQGFRDIIVVGAGILYGHGGGATPGFWLTDAGRRDAAWYIGDGAQRWSAGHVDDLATLVVRAAEVAPAGSVFNAVAGALPLRDAAEAVTRAAGVAGGAVSVSEARAREAWGPFWGDALAHNLWLSATRAERTLDWRPSAPSFLDELATGSYHAR